MSTDQNIIIHQMHLVGLDDIRKRSGWFLGLGAILILLGLIALGSSMLFTLTTMVFVGWLMMLAGVLQTVHAFTCKSWGGFFIDLLAGAFNTVLGLLIIGHPGATAVALTLMIAMSLIVRRKHHQASKEPFMSPNDNPSFIANPRIMGVVVESRIFDLFFARSPLPDALICLVQRIKKMRPISEKVVRFCSRDLQPVFSTCRTGGDVGIRDKSHSITSRQEEMSKNRSWSHLFS